MAKRRPKSTRERTLKKLVREAALQARVQHCSGVVKLLGAYEVRSLQRAGRVEELKRARERAVEVEMAAPSAFEKKKLLARR